MTFTVVQKIKGKHYLYECTGEWDSEKKQCRQKRVYIGPCDEDGNLLPEKKRLVIKESRTFGQYHLLKELAEQSGIADSLEKAFGKSDAERILAVAMLRISCPKTLRNIKNQIEETFAAELLGAEDDLTSQYLSGFLSRVGKKENAIAAYSKSMMKDDRTVILDMTSFGSSSKLFEMLEYGDDYRRTKLPQVSFSLAHSLDRDMPVYYKLCQGSIADKSTLKGMVTDLKDLGAPSSHAIMDRGFYSPSNISFMFEEGLGFTIPMPFGLKTAKELISESNKHLDDPVCCRMIGGSLVHIWETVSEPVEGKISRTIVFLDENSMNDQRNILFARITDFEKRMSGAKWHPGIFKELVKNRADRPLLKMFDIGRGKDGMVSAERKRNAMSFELNKCGKIIILTTSDDPAEDVLAAYRLKNEIEKLFETFKDELEGGISYLSSENSARGMIFAEFVAVTLHYVLASRLRTAGLGRNVWIPDIISLLNKLKITYMNDRWRLNEVSKKQREMYEALGVPIPAAHDYIGFKPLS
ncbi:MAG: transposase [Methanomassiliicoccaceae archaeon]|nr:transposase [Methanomassiliicoccaceae archaeon]